MPTTRTPSHLPHWLGAPAFLAALFVLLPLLATAGRVDWARFPALITSASSLDALRLSITTALSATALCVLLGVPLALVLARARFPGLPLVRALVLIPLVLPPVVSGIALLHTFGRRGLLGAHLEAAGIQVAFSTFAVVLAQTFVALPFLVLSLEGALRSRGTGYEETAAGLGAGPGRVLTHVTLPLVAPALATGAVLSFARALGEFGATIAFAGSLQGTTRTLPLEIYLQRESDPEAAVALSTLLIIVAVLVILIAHRRGSTGTGADRSGR